MISLFFFRTFVLLRVLDNLQNSSFLVFFVNWFYGVVKLFVKIWVIIGVGCLVSSCRTKYVMTKEEIVLIESANAEAVFRVLEITNPQDYMMLRTKCSDIHPVKDNPSLVHLIGRMKATLVQESGVGLAAPQVGILRNLFLFVRVDKPGQPIEVAINPRIVRHSDETLCFERDGCLSIPGVAGNSMRYPWVDVEYINGQGETVRERLEGYSRQGNFTGIIFQHEYDHLQGALFIDRLCEK